MRYSRRMASCPPHDWSTRHSASAMARRAAALVNVLAVRGPDGAADPEPEEVVALLREYGETGTLEVGAGDVARMRAAAVRLREVFAAGSLDEAAGALNGLLREHTAPLRLTAHGGASPWHAHVDRDDDAPWDVWFLASSCMALATLLWEEQRPPGGVCASPGCHRVFATHGSGPERRYCSRRCATRERVAAHRLAARAARSAAARAGSAAAPGPKRRPDRRPGGPTPVGGTADDRSAGGRRPGGRRPSANGRGADRADAPGRTGADAGRDAHGTRAGAPPGGQARRGDERGATGPAVGGGSAKRGLPSTGSDPSARQRQAKNPEKRARPGTTQCGRALAMLRFLPRCRVGGASSRPTRHT